MGDMQDQRDHIPQELQPKRGGWGLLRVLLFIFVIFLVLRLFFAHLLALLIVGPLVLGIPLLFLLIMCGGILVAAFFTMAGLFVCGVVLLSIVLLLATIFAMSWPVVILVAAFVIVLLLAHHKEGLDNEK